MALLRIFSGRILTKIKNILANYYKSLQIFYHLYEEILATSGYFSTRFKGAGEKGECSLPRCSGAKRNKGLNFCLNLPLLPALFLSASSSQVFLSVTL